jgi:hypothetical protein
LYCQQNYDFAEFRYNLMQHIMFLYFLKILLSKGIVFFYAITIRKKTITESINSSLFDEFVCKLGLFWHEWAILKCSFHSCQKRPNLHMNALNTKFFCSTSPLNAPNRLKPLKLAWRFVLTSCDIYQNPFT